MTSIENYDKTLAKKTKQRRKQTNTQTKNPAKTTTSRLTHEELIVKHCVDE